MTRLRVTHRTVKISGLLLVILMPCGGFAGYVTWPQPLHSPEPMMIRTAKMLEAAVGKEIVAEGSAADAKAGAVLDAGEFVIYLDGLLRWPAAIVGKKVRVNGVLAKEAYIPESTTNRHGGVSAGAAGPQYVLKRPKWQLRPAPRQPL
jgi:hypothetical protein